MISQIVGALWILLGIICLVCPGILKSWIGRKQNRRIWWIAVVVVVLLIYHSAGVIAGLESRALKILAVVALIFAVHAVWKFKRKASDKFLEHWNRIPLFVFRLAGAAFAAAGFLTLYRHQ